MSFSLLAMTGLACAALLESVRQQHVSAAPLLVVAAVLVYLVLNEKKDPALRTTKQLPNNMPPLERNPAIKDVKVDEFDGVAVPDRVVYVVPA
jgi:hypothetical protein